MTRALKSETSFKDPDMAHEFKLQSRLAKSPQRNHRFKLSTIPYKSRSVRSVHNDRPPLLNSPNKVMCSLTRFLKKHVIKKKIGVDDSQEMNLKYIDDLYERDKVDIKFNGLFRQLNIGPVDNLDLFFAKQSKK